MRFLSSAFFWPPGISFASTAPLVLIVQYLPDDAFYYLGISRNLGLLGKSSFDGGQTLTTGYHPLWAWASEFLGWLGGYQPRACCGK